MTVDPVAFDTVAIEVEPEIQVASFVRSRVELSLQVPVAFSCSVAAIATEPVAGVTAIDFSVWLPTVKVVVPEVPS